MQEAATIRPALCKLTFDLLNLESGVRVTCDVGYLCANFSLQASLFSTYARCARQTNVRRTSSLNTPYPRGGGIIMDEQNCYQMLLPHLSLSLLPARRRPQGLVVIGVCLSVCLCVCAHSFVRKISQKRVHGSPPNLVSGSRG